MYKKFAPGINFLFFLLVTLFSQISLALPRQILTHYDSIPDFCDVTGYVTAVRSGSYSDPSIWSSGSVPGAGTSVVVPSSTTIFYDANATAPLNALCIRPGGTLEFRTNINTVLTVSNLLVEEGGTLRIGTVGNPVDARVTAKIIVPDLPINTNFDPARWGGGVVVLGALETYGYAVRRRYVQVSRAPKAGDSVAEVAEDVNDWRVGDQVIFPGSDQVWAEPSRKRLYNAHTETRSIVSVSSDGLRLTLDRALVHDHPGADNPFDDRKALPHVANGTNNIIFTSANPNGVNRGHVALLYHAFANVNYTSFIGLGRTLNDLTETTVVDPSGNSVFNAKGRYGLHTHHMTPAGSVPVVSRFRGIVIDGLVTQPKGVRAGFWIHDSQLLDVEDLFGINAASWIIGTETGDEAYLNFRRVMTVNAMGYPTRLDARPEIAMAAAAGFWLVGTYKMTVEDIVSASAEGQAFVTFPNSSNPSGTVRVPIAPGLDPFLPGNSKLVGLSGMDARFDRVTTYGSQIAWELWYNGYYQCKEDGEVTSVQLNDFVTFNNTSMGLQYPTANQTLKNALVLQDPTKDGWPLDYGDYSTAGLVIKGGRFAGNYGAIKLSAQSDGGVFKVVDTKIKGGVSIYPIYSSNNVFSSPPRLISLENSTIEADPRIPVGGERPLHLLSNWAQFGYGSEDMALSQVELRNMTIGGRVINGKLYRPESHPLYPVPLSVIYRPWNGGRAAPYLGFTNQALFENFGQAVAGEVASCTNMLPGVAAMFCDSRTGSVIITDWSYYLKRSGSQFQVYLTTFANEPSKLDVRVNGSTVVSDPNFTNAHDLLIGTFDPGTSIFFNATVTASDGRTGTVYRTDLQTLGTPSIGNTSVPSSIEFAPDSPSSTSLPIEIWASFVKVIVEYSPSKDILLAGGGTIGFTSGDKLLGRMFRSIRAELRGLNPDTTYFMRVITIDGFGNTNTSVPLEFKTAKSPLTNVPTLTNVTTTTQQNRCKSIALPPLPDNRWSYVLHSIPQNGSVRFAENGTITYSPLPGAVGQDSFKVSAIDSRNAWYGYGARSNPMTVTVNVNSATSTAPVIDPLPNQVVGQGGTVELTVRATDPSGTGLTYAISSLVPATMNPVTGRVVFDAPLTFAAGLYDYTVRVRNGRGEESVAQATIRVTSISATATSTPSPTASPSPPSAATNTPTATPNSKTSPATATPTKTPQGGNPTATATPGSRSALEVAHPLFLRKTTDDSTDGFIFKNNTIEVILGNDGQPLAGDSKTWKLKGMVGSAPGPDETDITYQVQRALIQRWIARDPMTGLRLPLKIVRFGQRDGLPLFGCQYDDAWVPAVVVKKGDRQVVLTALDNRGLKRIRLPAATRPETVRCMVQGSLGFYMATEATDTTPASFVVIDSEGDDREVFRAPLPRGIKVESVFLVPSLDEAEEMLGVVTRSSNGEFGVMIRHLENGAIWKRVDFNFSGSTAPDVLTGIEKSSTRWIAVRDSSTKKFVVTMIP